MYINVYSITHNSQKGKKLSTDKQIMVYSYNGIVQHGQTLKRLCLVKAAAKDHVIPFHS